MRSDTQNRNGFTLIELITTIAIVAILAIILVYILNPAELLKQARDDQRVASINVLNNSISSYYADGLNTDPNSIFMGTSSIIYVSIPDPAATSTAGDQCQGLGLQLLPSNWTYKCAASSTYLKVNGTGWLPINFTSFSGGNIISKLPVDPINTTSSCNYYIYTTNGNNGYQITGSMEASKDRSLMLNDGGQYPDLYEKGTALLLLPEDIGGGTVWSVSNSQNSVQGFNGCTGQFISQFSGNGSNTLNAPDGMAIAPNGNFYVMNYANSHVEIFDANGSYISQFGSMGTGNGQFTNTGGGIAINAINENVYVSDGGDSRVEIFDANGNYISQFGSYGSGNGQFNGPAGIAIDTSGTVYVADYYNSRVEYFNANGTYISQFGVSGNGYSSGTLIDPRGLAIDTNSNIYVVSSYGGNRVDEFSLIGTWLSRFGSQGTGNGQFESPNGIAIGPGGKIYVADAGNNRVQVFDANENYLFQFSQPNPTFLFVR